MGQMYLGFQQVGEYEVADQIKTSILTKSANDDKIEPTISEKIFDHCVQSYINDPNTKEKYNKYRELNEHGIAYYKHGELNEALECFKEALKKVPTNTNVMLNKVQVLIDMSEQLSKNRSNDNKFKMIKLLSEAEQGLLTIEGISLTEAQFQRTKNLRTDLNELKELK